MSWNNNGGRDDNSYVIGREEKQQPKYILFVQVDNNTLRSTSITGNSKNTLVSAAFRIHEESLRDTFYIIEKKLSEPIHQELKIDRLALKTFDIITINKPIEDKKC